MDEGLVGCICRRTGVIASEVTLKDGKPTFPDHAIKQNNVR